MATMTDKAGPSASVERQRDRWTAISLLLLCWVLFAAFEQSPFKLQGAVLEALVERGRLHFVHGNMSGIMFENLDTKTLSFRFLFNIFPHEGRYYVNHAPGQFLLAAPWYAALVKLGWRFETNERLVWRLLVWLLTAPLGALGIMCVFVLARGWEVPWLPALLTSLTLALCSPWWPASGVLYHDSLAIALGLVGITLWNCRFASNGIGSIISPIAGGWLLAFAVVTSYLVAPIVVLIISFVLASRPSHRDLALLGCGFLPTISILPITNAISFGSPFATGYSAGGFDKNYPSPFDLANAWEKTGFYLWHDEYGLLGLFPVFFFAAVGLLRSSALKPTARKLLIALAGAHFLVIITMEHHGSVGWGMGRFFLPLYPLLIFGLTAFWDLPGWKGNTARALMFSSIVYSAAFALAGVWYGVQGVMEPGVPTLKLRLSVEHYSSYRALVWVAIVSGVIGEFMYYYGFGSHHGSIQRSSSPTLRQKILHESKVGVPKSARKRRRKK
jgi:hypothetical protein